MPSGGTGLSSGPSGPGGPYAPPNPPGSGQSCGASGGSNSPQQMAGVVWGHGDRHVDDPGSAQQEILNNLPDPGDIEGPFWGVTPNYICRAYPLPNGDLSIGTYYYR